jgi:hypothetical protein
MKKQSLLYIRNNPSLLTAVGFGLSGLPCLLAYDAGDVIPAILISGSVGGVCLAYVTKRRDSTVLAMFGFGSAFLIGGIVAGGSLILLAERSLSFFGFYTMYILGFGIAGLLSAAFTRSQLISITNSAVSFIVGSLVGGVAIGVLGELAGRRAALTSTIGLLITTAVGGALAGAVSESLDTQEQAESKNATPR